MTRGRSNDDGYALIAAVASILFFALVSLAVLAMTQRVLIAGQSEIDAARASAAADAGLAIGLRDLLSTSLLSRAPVTGRPRQVQFDDARLTIVMTSEGGKVPLNLLDETQLTALLEYAGLSGDPLEIARDSFLDWIDDDEDPRPYGAEAAYYAGKGLRARNAGFVTIGELGRVRGFTQNIVDKIAAIATTDFGNGPFDPSSASVAAIKIMYPKGDAAVTEIMRSREAGGQTTAFEFGNRVSLVARPVTISVTAAYASGAIGRSSCVVELTGATLRPYVVRHCA